MSRSARVRAASREDYPHFVRLFRELGVPEDPIQRQVWEAGAMASTVFVDDGVTPVAYAYYQTLPRCGYIRNIAVAPEYRRRGLGRLLMDHLAELFRSRGCNEWRLNVKLDNHGAMALYRACGMTDVYRAHALRLPRAVVRALPASPSRLRVAELPAAADRAAEDLFAMPEGLLTSLRARPGDLLLQLLSDASTPATRVGVARFSPSVPGAFPFRVQAPAMARALIDVLVTLMPEDDDTLILTVEDDAVLVDTLRAHGAIELLELAHMCGILS